MLTMHPNNPIPSDNDNPLVTALGHLRDMPLHPETVIRFAMHEFRIARPAAERLVTGFLALRRPIF